MKKFKGMPKYYKSLHRQVAKEKISTLPTDWYDWWHTHVDWDGKGNLGRWHRRQHLKMLFKCYQNIKCQIDKSNFTSQVFMLISNSDSSQDAVYIHTENPNGTEYPEKFSGVQWNIKVPALLKGLNIPKHLQLGVQENNGELWYYLK